MSVLTILPLALVAASGATRAPETASEPPEPLSPDRFYVNRSDIAVGVGIFSRSGVTALAPTLFLRLAVGDTFAGEVEVPGAILTGDEGTSVIGNLSFAGFARFTGRDAAGEVGFRVGVPTTRLDLTNRFVADASALSAATAMSGTYDAWRYAFERVTLAVPLRGEYLSPEGLSLRGELVPTFLVNTSDFDVPNFWLLGFYGSVGYSSPLVEAGLGFGAVATIPEEGDNDAQTFLEPKFRIKDPRSAVGAYAEFALRMNLDEPLGFAFDDDGFYAVIVRLGFALPTLTDNSTEDVFYR